MIYCTLLNPALDVLYRVNELQSGETITDIKSSLFPAGKGINVARVIKSLGEEVTITGLMPEMDYEKTVTFLNRYQIASKFLKIPGLMRINTTILEQSTNCVTHFNSESSVLPLRFQDEFMDFFTPQIHSDDIWCFSGSIPQGFDEDLYCKLIKACKGKATVAALDCRAKALHLGLRAQPLMVKPNLSELEELFSEPVKGVHHIALKGKRLIDMGIPYVFISLGGDGLIAMHDNDCLLCSAPQVKTVDTVGCGDALMAGLLVAWLRKFSFSEMCRLAVACGTSKSMHEGPGLITRDEVWQLMEDVQITAV